MRLQLIAILLIGSLPAFGQYNGGATTTNQNTGTGGSQGPTGPAGTNGNTILNGTTTPSNTIGANGDFYLQNPTTAPCLWGPKASGAWPGSCTSLVGPAGATGSAGATGATGSAGTNGTNGNTILSGSASPTSGNGNNGDFYLQNPGTSPCLWGPKASGAWPGSCVSLVGPAGSSPPFSTITSGTNTAAAMVVGAGASLGYGSTGTIKATSVNSAASTSNSTYSILIAPATSGDQTPATVAGLTVNPSTGQVSVPSSIVTGGASLAVAAGVTGGMGFQEGSTAFTPTAGQAGLRADSVTHLFKATLNGGAEFVSAASIPAPASIVSGAPATQTIASGTATMGTAAVAPGPPCATVVTVSAPNVAATDTLTYTPNTDPTAVTGYAPSSSGSLYIWAYPTSGNVNFKVCNNTAGSITPAALTLNWKVTR